MHFRTLTIRLLGLTAAAQIISALSDPFDVREASIDSIHNALYTGLTTCRYIVSAHIARIEAFNPTVNAIITLNPDALTLADQMDMQLRAGNVTGSMFCIPIILKDNYDTVGMNTTGGCLDLAGNKPTMDAPVVTALKGAGGIILGKANLHELALEGLSVSSLGGQTLNPYDQTRTPGGSSGGTGASIASNFAVWGTGTDTVNSLRSPASANSLFSVRPTRGLISRYGIIPISWTQDAIGPIARNVKDLAKALTVMASLGFDARDNTTALIPPTSKDVDYTEDLYAAPLTGLRLGLLTSFFNTTASNETTSVNVVMANMVSKLIDAGATVVSIGQADVYNATALSATLDVQTTEYQQELNTYLSDPNQGGSPGDSPRAPNFKSLYSSGKYLVIPSQYGYVTQALSSSTANSSYPTVKLGIANLTTALSDTFASNTLDAIIYPEQRNLVVPIGFPSQSGRNGILAALTGSPVVTVPAGFSNATDTAPGGIPIGMEILGLPWTCHLLLHIAIQLGLFRQYLFSDCPSCSNGSSRARNYNHTSQTQKDFPPAHFHPFYRL